MIIIQLDSEQLSGLIQNAVRKAVSEIPQSNTPQSEADRLFTIQQAAEFLNLSVPTLYTKVHNAEIPVCKKSKRLYFSKQELTDWVKAGRKKTTSEIAAEAEQYVNDKKKRG